MKLTNLSFLQAFSYKKVSAKFICFFILWSCLNFCLIQAQDTTQSNTQNNPSNTTQSDTTQSNLQEDVSQDDTSMEQWSNSDESMNESNSDESELPWSNNQLVLCDEAITAGFAQYGKYLLNPKDFRVLELQNIVQPYLSRLNQVLLEQGTDLVTLVLPPRGVLFPELNPASQYDYNQLVTDLETSGLTTISVTSILESYPADFFFEYDHHWTPFAAREVAKVIAKNIVIEPKSQQDYISSQIRYTWSPYNSRLKTLSKLCGSDYAARATLTKPTSPTNPSSPTTQANFLSSWTTTMAASEGLFDTRAIEFTRPSVLVGTSNSESSTLNFSGFLAEQTGLSISNYSFASSGALGSMMTYFLSDEYQQSNVENKPRFIFWEFLANPHTTDYNLNAIRYYRQIIPSIAGACKTTALAQTQYELESDSARHYLKLFEEEDVIATINSSEYYLSFDLSGDYLDRIIVDIEYNTGHIDQSSLHLLAPSGGQQQAYLEFLNTVSGQIESIHLTFPQVADFGGKTTIDVDLCLTP